MTRFGFRVAAYVATAVLIGSVGEARGADRSFTIDAREPGAGEIRPVHGVNDGPLSIAVPTLIDSYRYLGIPVVRTHDTYGRLDIQSADNTAGLYPDMSRDPDDPEAYHFGPADTFIQEILAVPARVFFRIGYSWEDPAVHNLPPADFDKFADIVAHIVAHYNKGWNNGFYYGIRDWEFWNEPDSWRFWTGTPDQFFDLYERTARRARQVDPSIHFGGAGILWWNEANYRDRFVRYCHERGVPLDFFSWHRYFETDWPGNYRYYAQQQRAFLDAEGLPGTQSVLSEWNYGSGSDESTQPERCDLRGAAFDTLVLASLQDGGVDEAHFYRGDNRPANVCEDFGLHYWSGVRKTTAYAFRGWKELSGQPHRRQVTGVDWQRHVAVAGRSEDGQTLKVLLANFSETSTAGFDLRIDHLGACGVSRTVSRSVLMDRGFRSVESFQSSDDPLRLQRAGAAPSVTIVTVSGLARWPANLRADDETCPVSLTLAWDAVPAASGYRVYRSGVSCAQALSSAEPVATVAATGWNDTSVAQGSEYCYVVEPIGAYGTCNGDRRPVVGICPAATPAPIAELSARRAGTDIEFTWESAQGSASYRVLRSTHPDPRTWGAPWRDGVVDADPAAPGVQWTDAGAAQTVPAVFFYSVDGVAPVSPIQR